MKPRSTHGIFLTWNDSRRSKSLSTRLGIRRVLYVAQRGGVPRHLLGTVQSVAFLARERPKLVWYQFSFLLALTLAAYARVMGRGRIRLVADLHTKALRREGHGFVRRIALPLKRWALGSCQCTLVTNPEDAKYARVRLGITPVTLPDPLPEVPDCPEAWSTDLSVDVVFICSFSEDEPVPLILEVCRRLSPRLSTAVTGNVRLLGKYFRGELQRVTRATGFLTEDDYWSILRHASCIVDLSLDPAALPCGAYEAIAVGKKPVVAYSESIVKILGNCATYTRLNPDDLERTVLNMLTPSALRTGPSLVATYQRLWNAQWKQVWDALVRGGCLPPR